MRLKTCPGALQKAKKLLEQRGYKRKVMAWFGVRLLFRTAIGPSGEETLLEESFRVVRAADEDDASSRAEALGKEQEHSYLNADGEQVNWQFVEVSEVQDLVEDEITDGMEVFSRLYRP